LTTAICHRTETLASAGGGVMESEPLCLLAHRRVTAGRLKLSANEYQSTRSSPRISFGSCDLRGRMSVYYMRFLSVPFEDNQCSPGLFNQPSFLCFPLLVVSRYGCGPHSRIRLSQPTQSSASSTTQSLPQHHHRLPRLSPLTWWGWMLVETAQMMSLKG
jgi:hypothetical protein